MSKQYKCIRVTHFINPHLFWYHEADVPSETYDEVLDLGKQLDQIDQQNVVEPTVGAQVAVHYLSSNKLIRARVDHIETFSNVHGGQYIMWAIDYGFPFKTKVDHIFELPERFKKEINHVHLGGLVGIWPAERYYDSILKRSKTRKTEKWSRLACDTMEKLLAEAETIEFVESFSLSKHSWGELQLTTHMREKYNIRDYLLEMHLGKAGQNFRGICGKLNTTKILPWTTNDGNTDFKYEYNEDASFDNMDDCDERTVADCLRNQKIALAGEGTKRHIRKYKNGNLPPVPESHHFLSKLCSIEECSETASLASNTGATSHGSRVPSERLQLIMEERK